MNGSTRWWTLTLALAPALAGCTADDSFAADGGTQPSSDATLYDVPSLPKMDATSEEAGPGDATADAVVEASDAPDDTTVGDAGAEVSPD